MWATEPCLDTGTLCFSTDCYSPAMSVTELLARDDKPCTLWLFPLLGMPAETTTAICSMIMGGVFEKFPKLKVCFAHGGKDPICTGQLSYHSKIPLLGGLNDQN